jgi:hypothetical protein
LQRTKRSKSSIYVSASMGAIYCPEVTFVMEIAPELATDLTLEKPVPVKNTVDFS